MQKNHQKLLLFVVLSFFCFGFNPIAWAGFDESLDAYNRKDFITAFRELSLLSKQDNPRVHYGLGLLYENGLGVIKDEQHAILWYSKAAEKGHIGAQFNLAYMYGAGRGVIKDEVQAASWFRKAAEQNNLEAQYSLGLFYSNGQGLIKDDKQALIWYRKAAEQGYSEAQNNLATIYYKDIGTSKNDMHAYFWWLLAGAKGAEKANQNIVVVEKLLNPQQRAQAQAEARNWRPKTAEQVAKIGLRDGNEDNVERDKNKPQDDGEKSSGTGFAVSPNQIITNVHVVDGCSVLKVNGKLATLHSMDKTNDLALLNTNFNNSVAFLRTGNLRQGDEINAVGYPLHGLLASGAQITSGNVSALAGMQNDSRFIQISAPVQPGNSGGPLVDASGNVVGVIVSKLNAVAIASMNGDIPQNINFAISPLVLKGFLEANLVKYKTAASNKNLSTANVMSIATRYTVLVECIK